MNGRRNIVSGVMCHWKVANAFLDSDIIYLNVLGSPIVVLNSYKAANDLLGVRSTLYSDR